MRRLLDDDAVAGPVNLTAPNPVTNAEFTKALGAAVHRPTVLPTPLFPLKLVYGSELVEHLLVNGQRVLPRVLEGRGHEFAHPEIDGALRAVLAAPAAA
jgi:NAD dependent epimerase/dehydratase family enzyme